ncbi:uncharacterized protein LOC142232838 [Haematobia irritans]|uniref:uncharacterized protein LOC142232838 n=1 Tax=Haematobia irritans TaxID=7368 RepID=UPI003F503E2E
MAQEPDYYDALLDVDNTVLSPSPQRVRNILTLEERVAAIKAYNQRPMYTKVARMFNCSWEQIKNIVTNRDAIMEFYEATKTQKEFNRIDEIQMDLKQRKIKFLSECVYEYIQRVHYHMKSPITEELIKMKAMEFQDYVKLDDFVPNKKWMNLFKATYNISIANKQITVTHVPPSSLDLKEIVAYCSKNRTNCNSNSMHMKDLRQKYDSLDAKTAEYEIRRVRKLNFLQKALNEYLHRAKFHHKSMKLDDEALQSVAHEFNEILKVQDFFPTLTWIREFRERHNSSASQDNNVNSGKRPLLSLDLKDILSYCSRMDNKSKQCTITLKQKDPTTPKHSIPKFPGWPPDTKIKFQHNHIIYLDDEEEEKDVKPIINEIKLQTNDEQEKHPPLKIRKIESINNDPVLQNELRRQHQQENCQIQSQPVNESIAIKIENDMETENMKSVITSTISPTCESMTGKNEKQKIPTPTVISHSSQALNAIKSPLLKKSNTTHIDTAGDEEMELPRQIRNAKDALRLLKPLEEYAMLRENYRAIGLITQLEEIFKNSADNRSDEDFCT